MPDIIHSALTDDNDFIALLNSIVHGLLSQQIPERVWIIQIDNWFDQKWLRYSGNGTAANWMFAGGPSFGFFAERFDSVKTEFSQSRLTLPPFSPGRILGQWSFSKSGDGYVEFPWPSMPHKTEKVRSGRNLHRHVEDFSGSASLVWYSGNTIKNDRGSLMIYTVANSQIVSWYASFQRKGVWSLSNTKDISREEILQFMDKI